MVAIYTQLLGEEYGDRLDDSARSYIDQSLRATRRMETLLQALLAYSLVTAPAENESEVEANEAAQDAIGNLESLLKRTEATVTISDLPRVRLPAVRLTQVLQNLVGNSMCKVRSAWPSYTSTQVLQNLVGNSIKYRREGVPPRIELTATRNGGCGWLFSVRDNGMGIAPQYLTQIFGIFKRPWARLRRYRDWFSNLPAHYRKRGWQDLGRTRGTRRYNHQIYPSARLTAGKFCTSPETSADKRSPWVANWLSGDGDQIAKETDERTHAAMLWTMAAVLVIACFSGLASSYILNGFISILLFLAVTVVLIRVIQGWRTV